METPQDSEPGEYAFAGELPPDVQLSEVLFPSSGYLAGSQTVGAHNVDAVLSASHYPVPQAVRIRNLFSDSHGSTLSVNDFLSVLHRVESPEAEAIRLDAEEDADADGDVDIDYEPAPARTRQPTPSPISRPPRAKPKPQRKKPGRPRLAIKGGEEAENNTSERRRKQLREAQRGYRMRKESRISDLVRRVAQLESSMDNIVTSVVSLTEQITQSGALADHADLSSQLSSVLQTCLSSIKETNTDGEEYPATGLPSPPVQLPLPNPIKTHLLAPMPLPVFNARHAILTPPNSRGNVVMLPDFINNLIFSILYYGYTMLADPATPWERLVRHFQLVLPTVGREQMTMYFASAFHAKIRREKHLNGWNDVPLFRLGGAGTHYATAPESHEVTAAYRYPEPLPSYKTISATAESFPSKLYDEVEGDWFDFADLQLYLRDKSPDLRTAASASIGSNTGATDATLLARALVKKATCLGRSAGFRRRDVEEALQAAAMT